MIARAITQADELFRVLVPRWAYLPTSGAGAAVSGGRFNRYGLEAIYLSMESSTALAEYRQTSDFLPAGTLASYRANASVVDLAAFDSNDPAWDGLWALWDADWREALFRQRIEPATWLLGEMAMAAGYHGILFPSTIRQGGTNLVLYPSTFGGEIGLECVDPEHRLPNDDSSWR